MAHKVTRMLHLEFVGLGVVGLYQSSWSAGNRIWCGKGPAHPAGWSYSACIARIVLLLFQRHADELAARAHTGLGEQLLQRGLHRALRYLDSFRNLLVRQTLKHEGEHLALPFGEPFRFILGARLVFANRLAKEFLIEPHLARHYIADSFREQCR